MNLKGKIIYILKVLIKALAITLFYVFFAILLKETISAKNVKLIIDISLLFITLISIIWAIISVYINNENLENMKRINKIEGVRPKFSIDPVVVEDRRNFIKAIFYSPEETLIDKVNVYHVEIDKEKNEIIRSKELYVISFLEEKDWNDESYITTNMRTNEAYYINTKEDNPISDIYNKDSDLYLLIEAETYFGEQIKFLFGYNTNDYYVGLNSKSLNKRLRKNLEHSFYNEFVGIKILNDFK
ncbi:hypothetical protein H0243_14040 [Staphylococcus sciuri]|uniref:hypothetical protein n=1 Tax=Mammaliicoccus sciuri TaxID=1296 RepID=UPI0018CB1310|nr:hypothetical protein [Mammaliicoccus sciuri]MBG9206911.1 hypothetical protein [Mammaliicoccus sciuri]